MYKNVSVSLRGWSPTWHHVHWGRCAWTSQDSTHP